MSLVAVVSRAPTTPDAPPRIPHGRGRRPDRFRLVVRLLAALAVTTPAATTASGDTPGSAAREPWNTGWSLYVDNDALFVGRDQQYTGGLALTLSGRRATEYWWSLDPALQRLDAWTGIADLGGNERRIRRHSIHLGITGFTPRNIGEPEPIPDDRPYASLVFVSNTQQRVLVDRRVAYQSSLIVGLLGTNVVRAIQNALHPLGGRTKPRGWDNQISDGGELTASYLVARHETIALHQGRHTSDYQLQTGIRGSLGFVTQVGVGIAGRWGRFTTPWWAFIPDYAEYINLGFPVSGRGARQADANDLYAWAGLDLRYNLYNALLEGQFRDSAVTYDRDELRSTLAEVAVGLTRGVGDGGHITLALRARTSELRDASAAQPIWGTIVFSRTY